MDLVIVTKKDMEVVEQYIKEEDFFKRDTPNTIKETFIALIAYGMNAEIAINNIRAVVSALKDEYGE